MTVALTRVASVILIVFGAITLPLPLPTGAIALVVGLALLASTSPWMLRKLRTFRARNAKLNRTMERVEPRVPGALKKALRESRPEQAGKKEDEIRETPAGR
jgi:hypothetical protein